jgi:phosphate starvation-inducible PhoH-like protein
MKMFLTRLGFGSKFIVTGDSTQRDLHGESGLQSAQRILQGIPDIAFIELEKADIVRHTLVGLIVEAYEKDHA